MPPHLPNPLTLLITLDAFHTLYRPRHPIATQYLALAASHGLRIRDPTSPTTIDAFTASFAKAFQANYARAPNYGHGHGDAPSHHRPLTRTLPLTPERWWRDVVYETFAPLLGDGERVPDGLAEGLFRHFGGREAYELFADVGLFLRRVGQWKGRSEGGLDRAFGVGMGVGKVVVGVLTNSDPRVSSVLGSLGLEVGVGVGVPGQRRNEAKPGGEGVGHVDFVLTSYEIGVEKPDPRAFLAAERMARWVSRLQFQPPASSGPSPSSSSSFAPPPSKDMLVAPEDENENEEAEAEDDMLKVHIGDDLQKDYFGAINAGRGWDAILLDRSRDPNSTENRHAATTGQPGRKAEGDDNASAAVDGGARRVSSLAGAVDVILELARQRSWR